MLHREVKLSEHYVYGEANGAQQAETEQVALDKMNAFAIEMLVEGGKRLSPFPFFKIDKSQITEVTVSVPDLNFTPLNLRVSMPKFNMKN